jgi:hypothetical protein
MPPPMIVLIGASSHGVPDFGGAGNFGCTPLGGTMSKREPQIGGLKLWAIMFLCPSERSDEAARGLTFGPRIEGTAPKEWQSSSGQVAVE